MAAVMAAVADRSTWSKASSTEPIPAPMTKRLIAALLLTAQAMATLAQAVDYEARMRQRGLVDLATLGPTVTIDLKYATTDNFTGKNLYGKFNRAYLHPNAARALKAALQQLRAIDSNYGFIIYDAARPLSVQRIMWQAVRGTPQQRYVASPHRGGPHNYGVAIDISLTYKGRPMDMGTPFDTFTADAHITNEQQLVERRRISQHALRNRQLLRKVLTENGFLTFSREWWHFEYCRASQARRTIALLNF